MTKQTYANYHRDYFNTPKGRIAKQKAQTKYRQKLAKLYGLPQREALLKHKEMLNSRTGQTQDR